MNIPVIASLAVASALIVLFLTRARYEKADSLLTGAELRFYRFASRCIGMDLVLYPKVRVADILVVRGGLTKAAWWGAFRQVSQKHFDFTVCRRSDLSIIGVIEVDDRSHEGRDRRVRDRFLNRACEAAKLPLIRVATGVRLDADTLKKTVREACGIGDEVQSSAAASWRNRQ